MAMQSIIEYATSDESVELPAYSDGLRFDMNRTTLLAELRPDGGVRTVSRKNTEPVRLILVLEFGRQQKISRKRARIQSHRGQGVPPLPPSPRLRSKTTSFRMPSVLFHVEAMAVSP